MVKKTVVEGKRAYFDTGMTAHCRGEIKQFLTEVFTGRFGRREMLQTGFHDKPQPLQLPGRPQRDRLPQCTHSSTSRVIPKRSISSAR